MKKVNLFFGTVLVIFLILPIFVFADEHPMIYLRSEVKNLAPDSIFAVDLLIDSEKPINVVNLEIGFPVKSLTLMGVDSSQSIIDVWRVSPNGKESGIIKIEGGLTNPFSGKEGKIIKLFFKADQEGVINFPFFTYDVYYADGLGTKVIAKTSFTSINISSDFPKIVLSIYEDKTYPLLSKIEIIRDPITQSVLAVFDVFDENSGIKSSYIRWRKWFFWSEWHQVSNPAPLPKGIWSFEIIVFDNQDNKTSQTVYMWREIFKKLLYLFFLVFALSALIFLIRYFISTKKKMLYN